MAHWAKGSSKDSKRIQVRLPARLLADAEQRMVKTGLPTMSDYVRAALLTFHKQEDRAEQFVKMTQEQVRRTKTVEKSLKMMYAAISVLARNTVPPEKRSAFQEQVEAEFRQGEDFGFVNLSIANPTAEGVDA